MKALSLLWRLKLVIHEHENDQCQLLDVGLHVFGGEECELHEGEHQLDHQGGDPSLVPLLSLLLVLIINTSEK